MSERQPTVTEMFVVGDDGNIVANPDLVALLSPIDGQEKKKGEVSKTQPGSTPIDSSGSDTDVSGPVTWIDRVASKYD